MPEHPRNSDDLVRILLNRASGRPNFALFIGAGASVTSGVMAANEMIEDWRSKLYLASHSQQPFSEWLKGQSWFRHEDEYSLLFELVYDHPSQRRVYIEEWVKQAHPSWGYVYLTGLLANQVFDIVLTTNFDDLVNESCYLFSESLRPLLAAQDSSISTLRMSSERPKIIKLHGDFLYDNIKNTISELETLEANTRRKFAQIAQEYGLVVVGYGGRDRSVMDVLELLLRSEFYFSNGVYWCIRASDDKPRRLEALLRRGVHLVTIDGFDQFMASVHNAGEFTLPEPVAAPLKVARDRARLFIDVDATHSERRCRCCSQ